jgi:phosphoribosylformimino-5-aminoimidazole carboxamide ribotide isomerase
VPPRAASTFEILPAIDLRGGHVVRLERGDFARETAFGDDPVDQARAFAAAGARWLHVVDLEGARDGRRRQADLVAAIVDAAGEMRVQVAGGLRDPAAIAGALATGASRAVLGTVAITRPDVVRAAVEEHGPARIAVALDVRDGRAVGGGWVEGAPTIDLAAALDDLATAGVETVIVTAIERDGLLSGPDLALLARVVGATPAAVIASAGVTTLDDLRAVRAAGCAGAIVGRALYDGRLDLASVIRAMDGDEGGVTAISG